MELAKVPYFFPRENEHLVLCEFFVDLHLVSFASPTTISQNSGVRLLIYCSRRNKMKKILLT